MLIKDLVAYLNKLDQDAEILAADYYYDALEGFSNTELPLKDMIVRPIESAYHKQYTGNVYLLDFSCTIAKDI